MNEVRLNESFPLVLSTEDSAGAATDTDGVPVVVLRRGGSVATAVATVTNPAVGVRDIAVGIAASQGWAVGDLGQGYVEYAMGGVTQRRGFSFVVRAELPQGEGAHALTIMVSDAGVGVAGVRVALPAAGLAGVSDTLGRVAFHVDSGTYLVRVMSTPWYETPADREVTVSADQSTAIALTVRSVPVAGAPNLVNVLVRTRDFGVARAGVPVEMRMEARSPVILQGALEFDRVAFAVTDSEGDALIGVYPSSLLAGAGYLDTYTVSLATMGVSFRVRVGDDGGNVVGMRI